MQAPVHFGRPLSLVLGVIAAATVKLSFVPVTFLTA